MNPFQGWRITSPYGYRNDPFTGQRVKHTGIDLSIRDKYLIPAFVEGKVLYTGNGGGRKGYGAGYGIIVVIHDANDHINLYAHLDSVNVKAGQQIKKGDVIGKQGNTGRSTASHLHFEVRTSEIYLTDIDPAKYLVDLYEKEVAQEMSPEDANKIIRFLSAGYFVMQGNKEAEQEFNRLANELRKASGQKEQ